MLLRRHPQRRDYEQSATSKPVKQEERKPANEQKVSQRRRRKNGR